MSKLVILNGLTGKMGKVIAEGVLNDHKLSLHGRAIGRSKKRVSIEYSMGEYEVETIPPREFVKGHIPEGAILVDYTQPEGVLDNVKLYCEQEIPFVMGTSIATEEKPEVYDMVRNSNISAVIAPNMSPEIVFMQAIMRHGAETFPGVLSGLAAKIEESHQETKAGTSATAKAISGDLRTLGVSHAEEANINKIRGETKSLAFGVPKQHLSGHGHHRYILSSPNSEIELGFVHNVNGRDTYVQGTLMAVKFLQRKIAEGLTGQVYPMEDVIGR